MHKTEQIDHRNYDPFSELSKIVVDMENNNWSGATGGHELQTFGDHKSPYAKFMEVKTKLSALKTAADVGLAEGKTTNEKGDVLPNPKWSEVRPRTLKLIQGDDFVAEKRIADELRTDFQQLISALDEAFGL